MGRRRALSDVALSTALQRKYELRAVFNAVRYLAHTGAPWRYLPSDFPPWAVVYQQAPTLAGGGEFRGAGAGCAVCCCASSRADKPQPSAVILDARVLQSTPESGSRAGYSGRQAAQGIQSRTSPWIRWAIPLALTVTPASEDERTQVETLATQVQAATGEHVEIAYVDAGLHRSRSRGQRGGARHRVGRRQDPRSQTRLRLAAQKMGGGAQFRLDRPLRRLARDFERLPSVLAGLHFLAFACLMLHQVIHLYSSS